MMQRTPAQPVKSFWQRYKIQITSAGFAILIWFLVVSNGIYDYEITVPVETPLLQPYYVITNDLPQHARIKIRGQGLALMTFKLFREGRLELNVEWKPGEGIIYPRIQDIVLGSGAHSISVLQIVEPLEIPLFIEETSSRILPVKHRITIKPLPGYTVVGDVRLDPDQVTVRGAHSLLQNLEAIDTAELLLQKVRNSLRDNIALISPLPQKVYLQPSEVHFQAEIQKLMERRLDQIMVGVRNLPSGYRAIVLPASLSLVAEGGVNIISELGARDIVAYIDYSRQQDSSGAQFPAYLVPVENVRYRDISPKLFKILLERE